MQFQNKFLTPSGFKIKKRYKYFLDLSIMNDKSEDKGFYELAKNPLIEHLSMMILGIRLLLGISFQLTLVICANFSGVYVNKPWDCIVLFGL